MSDPAKYGKNRVGVSYKAEAPIYGLHISVHSTHTGTVVGVYYTERQRGDEPLQGRCWQFRFESDKQAKSFAHLTNLAAWAVRQCLAGKWVKRR